MDSERSSPRALLDTEQLRSDDARLAREPPSAEPLVPTATPRPAGRQTFHVRVERLMPLAGTFVTAHAAMRVEELRAEYLRSTAPTAAPKSGAAPREDVRMIFNGVALAGAATLGDAGVAEGSVVCAMHVPLQRSSYLLRHIRRWWPVCFVTALFAGVAYEMFGDEPARGSRCDRPLILFNLVASTLLLLYAVVFSGMFQDERGRRLLWPLRESAATAVSSGVAVVGALATFIAGSVWLFQPGSGCATVAAHVWYSALGLWVLMLLINLPWLVLVALPVLLLCQCEPGFAILRRLSGVHRSAM